ncbi:hypothetical protein pb186bvf_014436 [Paramecium bursaria]
MKGFFSLQFENIELEKKYQIQQQKYIKQSADRQIYIISLGEIITILEIIKSMNYMIVLFSIGLLLMNVVMLCLIKKKKIDVKYVILYFNTLCITGILTQTFYIQFSQIINFTESQLFVQLDIIHQFITLFNFGQSHITSSIIYVLFVISRVFIQVSYGYTYFSLTFLVFGLFYIKDQYEKAKQRRKQFLKSQRNKLLEQLIKEFIDEKVCIIQKDEDNVKFIPMIVNNKLQEFSSDINQIFQALKLCNYKVSLQQHLYKTLKEKETLLCSYKNQVYQITYQRFILKTCQIFIKIQHVYHNQPSIINYKELYLQFLSKIQQFERKHQLRCQLRNKLQSKLFLYWFKKYSFCYKVRIVQISIQQILVQKVFFLLQGQDSVDKCLIIKEIFELDISEFNTDLLLLYLLLNQLRKCVVECQTKLFQIKDGILIEIQCLIQQPIKQEWTYLIDKILYHIGIGVIKVDGLKNQTTLTIKLLNIKDRKFISYNE